MADHRWGVVTVHTLDPTSAAQLHELHGPADRANLLESIPFEILEVRGPICLDCRVHWRDVHKNPAEPWPCGGIRPEELDGPVVQPEQVLSRPQRRKLQRQLAKAGR